MTLRRALFIGVFLFLWATGSRDSPSNDAATYVSVANSIISEGTLALPYHSPGYTVVGPDGNVYAKYPLPWSLMLVPEAAIERLLSTSDLEMSLKELYIRIVRGVTPALFGALAVTMLFLALVARGVQARGAAFISLAFHLATFALPYLKSHYSEVFQMACVNLAILAMVRVRDRPSLGNVALLGFSAGLLVLAKVTLALFAVAVIAGAIASQKRREIGDWRLWATGAAAAAIPMAVFAWYNHLRWGEIVVTHYADYLVPERLDHPLHEGLFGLLISSGRGLLWYAPLAMLGIAGAVRTAVYDRRDAIGIANLLGIVATVLFYSSWTVWHGAEQWGPRFLVTMIGPLAWLAAPIVSSRRVITGLLVALGFAVNLPAYLVNPQRFFSVVPYRPYSEVRLDATGRPLEPVDPDNLRRVNFSPPFSPILGQTWLLKHAVLGGDIENDAPWRNALLPGEPVVRTNGLKPRLDLWLMPDENWPTPTSVVSVTIFSILTIACGAIVGSAVLQHPHRSQ